MFVGRLALKRGGEAIDNPLEWFDELPGQTVEFWKVFYKLEPFGGEWHRHARVCQMLDRVAQRVAKADGETIADQATYMPADFVQLDFTETEPVPIAKQLDALAKAHAKNGNDD